VTHPASCNDPANCTLSYVEHLRGFVLGVNAIPSRAIHRTPRSSSGWKPPDEPAWRTEARERRWAKDMPAFKRLHDAGHTPEHIDGSAQLEKDLGG
jgi:hypothetical protein